MKQTTDKTIGIIGAGISGLTLAYLLAEKGYSVSVFEQESSMGGLARTIPFLDTEIERFYHFICRYDSHLIDLIQRLDLGEHLCWRQTAMDYHVDGTLYPFTDPLDLLKFKPLSFWDRLRFGFSMIPFRLNIDWRKLDGVPHRDWLIKWGGQRVYDAIWKPLMIKKYHEHYLDIPAAWVWGRTRRRGRSRRGVPSHESLGYLNGGTQRLLKSLIAKIEEKGGHVLLDTKVTHIQSCDDMMQIQTPTDKYLHHRVVSTLPAPILANLAAGLPDPFRKRLSGQEYLAVICPIFGVEGKLANNYWTNIYEVEIPYLGVIEFSRLNPDPGFRGMSVAYLPFYIWQDNPLWQYDDKRIIEIAIRDLQKLFPWFDSSKIRESVVHRDAFSQPMIRTGHLNRIFSFETPDPKLFMLEASMIYPEDRGLNNCIRLAADLARKHF